MRCRKLYNKEIVWFGSYGKNQDGTAKLIYDKSTIKQDFDVYKNSKFNFSQNENAIVDSLTQKLSVLKNELWYDINFGLPLFDKQKSKIAIDSTVGKIVLSHKDVLSIEYFNSKVVDKVYTCELKIKCVYGSININI